MQPTSISQQIFSHAQNTSVTIAYPRILQRKLICVNLHVLMSEHFLRPRLTIQGHRPNNLIMPSPIGTSNGTFHDPVYVKVGGVLGDKMRPGMSRQSCYSLWMVDLNGSEVGSRKPRYRLSNELLSMPGRYLFAYCSPMDYGHAGGYREKWISVGTVWICAIELARFAFFITGEAD